MHKQYWPLAVSVPAGTSPGSPASLSWPLTWGILETIDIDNPGGGNGVLAIRLTYFGTEIIPWALSSWLVMVRSSYTFNWGDQIMPWGMQVQAYNTGNFAHSLYLRAQIDPNIGTYEPFVHGGQQAKARKIRSSSAVTTMARTITADQS